MKLLEGRRRSSKKGILSVNLRVCALNVRQDNGNREDKLKTIGIVNRARLVETSDIRRQI